MGEGEKARSSLPLFFFMAEGTEREGRKEEKSLGRMGNSIFFFFFNVYYYRAATTTTTITILPPGRLPRSQEDAFFLLFYRS